MIISIFIIIITCHNLLVLLALPRPPLLHHSSLRQAPPVQLRLSHALFQSNQFYPKAYQNQGYQQTLTPTF